MRAASPGRLRAETSGITSGGAARNEASSLPFLFRNASSMVEKKEHRAGRAGRRGQLCRPVPWLKDATRLPNGQILPNIPPNSLFCVTLPASRTGRLCQADHHTHSFALPYPLPERADSVKHITTLFPLGYPTRFRNGQTRPKIPTTLFLLRYVTRVPNGQIPPNMPQHSFNFSKLPAARMGRFCKTLFLLRSHV